MRSICIRGWTCIRCLVWCVGVTRRAHRTLCDCRDRALLVNSRLRIHALLRSDVSKLWVVGGLDEILRV